MKQKLIITLVLCLSIFVLQPVALKAQIEVDGVSQAQMEQARQELKKRNISEQEVIKRLRERGYDPDNIRPEQLPQYQRAVDEIIAEIESERVDQITEKKENLEKQVQLEKQADREVKEKITEKSEDIKQRMKEGASAEEALSEERTETLQEKAPKVNIYGHQIFKNAEISLYRAADEISTPPDYVLTTGDEVIISIFGASQADFASKVSREGFISPAGTEKIFIKGLTITKASELVRQRLQRRFKFRNDQFSLTLSTARTVTMNIFGEVQQPGSFTISAINTGFNALVAAGGPTPGGSVRNIRLIKGNGETKNLDVYQYLTNPKVKYDYAIDDQDIIFVPLSEKIVQIEGAVRRPMRYEMKDDETLEDLIAFAGGLESNAYTELIQISRQGVDQRILIDIPLNEYLDSELEFDLQDGDKISIKTIPDELKNYVSSSGEVKYPGQYSYEEGMTLQDLIDKSAFTEYTRPDIAFLFREKLDGTISLEKLNLPTINAEQFLLQRKDQIRFFSIKAYVDPTRTIGITGAVRRPDTLTFDPAERIKISDLILIAGGLEQNAHPKALLTRENPSNKEEKIYSNVDVFTAISDTSSAENITLKEGDRLTVYTNERYNELGTVSILGQVKSPQEIQYDESLTLEELLLIAGGLKENASNIAIVKRRARDNDKEVAYIRFNIDEVISGESDLELRRDDEIRIYDKNVYLEAYEISVMGEVNQPGNFEYDESLTIRDVIYMAGGLTRRASTNKVEIYRVDFTENEPTRILLKEITLEKQANDRVVPTTDVQLEPYDILIIRPIPDYKLQEVAYVNGEVRYPGPYILNSEGEKLKDVIKQAGGLSPDGFAEGAQLFRKRGERDGLIMINLNDALRPGNNHENIVLRNGDIITIPKKENIVSIRAYATLSDKVYEDTLLYRGAIQMAYQGKKSAKWYIKNYAGGFEDRADKNSVRVIEQNGRVKATNKILWIIRDYPTVTEGSVVEVDMKPPKVEKDKKEAKPVDWSKVITDTFAILSSAMTIIVLATQLK